MEQALNYELSLSMVAAVLGLLALAYVAPKAKTAWTNLKPTRRIKMISTACWLAAAGMLGTGIGDFAAKQDDATIWLPPQFRVMLIMVGIATAILGIVLFIRHCDNYE